MTSVDAAFLASWERLRREAVQPNPFHQPQCLLPAARWLADGADVQLLVARAGGQLLFLLPVHTLRRYRRMPIRTLAWWRHPYAYDGTPLLARTVDPGEVWTAVRAHLHGMCGMFAMELVAPQQPVIRPLMSRGLGRRAVVFDAYDRAVLHRRTEPTYLEGRLSARHRKNLRRLRRRLEEELGSAVGVVDHAADGQEAFDRAVNDFLSLEAAGWKGRDGGAFAVRPGHAEFFREMAAAFRREGQLEFWSLGNGTRAAAYQCNILADEVAFHFKVAFDERLARWSPGVQLEIEMVEQFHRDSRLQMIDSCTAPGTTVSEQLYPDRQRTTTLLLATAGAGSELLARSAPLLRQARRTLSRGAPEA